MNWKEFLKPDWRKVVLSITLVALFFCGLFLAGGESGGKYIFFEKIILLLGFVGLAFIIPLLVLFNIFNIELSFYFLLFIFPIYSYLISCFIISELKKRESERGKKIMQQIQQPEILVYVFWILTFIVSLIFPTFYTPFITAIIAIYFAEKVKKQDKNKGNILIIVSVIILIINVILVMGFWSAFLSRLI